MRIHKRHILAGVMLAAATALIAAFAITASAAAPVKITNCIKASSRPKTLTLACGDGNTVLKSLSWSSFGAATAKAKGTFVVNTCEPNCAAGKDVSYPVSVKAGSPRGCKGGLRVYNKLTLQFSGRAPGPAVPRTWTLGCPT